MLPRLVQFKDVVVWPVAGENTRAGEKAVRQWLAKMFEVEEEDVSRGFQLAKKGEVRVEGGWKFAVTVGAADTE